MKGIAKLRPSPAMVVACLALFVALGSGTYAAVKLKANSVKTKNIRTAAVTGPKIATDAVTESKIAANAVSGVKIAGGAVTGPKLGADSVDASKIAPNAVTEPKIAAGAVTKGKFAASGTATNTSGYTLDDSCALESFDAPGVQPGDAIAYSFGETIPGGQLSAAPGADTAGAGVIRVLICEHVGTPAPVMPGLMTLDWVAIR